MRAREICERSSKSNEIWNIEVKKRDPARFYGGDQILYKSSDSIYWIRHFDSKNKIMGSPTSYFFDKAFRLIKRDRRQERDQERRHLEDRTRDHSRGQR